MSARPPDEGKFELVVVVEVVLEVLPVDEALEELDSEVTLSSILVC